MNDTRALIAAIERDTTLRSLLERHRARARELGCNDDLTEEELLALAELDWDDSESD